MTRMRLLKKIIPVLLFGVIALMPVLFSASFLVRQYQARKAMRVKLEQLHLQTIHIPVNELQWLEEGEELMVGNEHFDVKSMTVSEGIARLQGLFDRTEELLYNQLNAFIPGQEEDSPGNSSESCFSISFGSDKHFFPGSMALIPAAFSGLHFPPTERISTRAIAVLTPPPNG